jgi:hypothetical protein
MISRWTSLPNRRKKRRHRGHLNRKKPKKNKAKLFWFPIHMKFKQLGTTQFVNKLKTNTKLYHIKQAMLARLLRLRLFRSKLRV